MLTLPKIHSKYPIRFFCNKIKMSLVFTCFYISIQKEFKPSIEKIYLFNLQIHFQNTQYSSFVTKAKQVLFCKTHSIIVLNNHPTEHPNNMLLVSCCHQDQQPPTPHLYNTLLDSCLLREIKV